MSPEPGKYSAAIHDLAEEIGRLEQEAAELKRTVNKLCERDGRSPMYSDVESQRGPSTRSIRADQFFGLAQSTAIRRFLEIRGDPNAGGLGAATVNEIHEALVAGGYSFDTKNDDNAKRGLRISLTKNSRDFVRVPNGAFGLVEWYGGKIPKPSGSTERTSTDDTSSNNKVPSEAPKETADDESTSQSSAA